MELNKKRLTQIVLFIVTLITTTIAGAEWRYGKYLFTEDPLQLSQIPGGLWYSLSFLGILTVHEFGHYFMAQFHKVKVTLPYYIPLWFGFLPGFPSLGTMGAFIRIKEQVLSRKHYFDIGVAGPLAGFVVAVGVIIYGFLNIPPLEYLFEIHPDYAQYGQDYAKYVFNTKEAGAVIKFGPNLFFWLCENYLPIDRDLLPHDNEVIHYPFFLAGYLALLFTSLNLFPIGQLDGGHVLYGLLGRKVHRKFAPAFFVCLIYYAGLGIIEPGIGFEEMLSAVIYVFFLYFCFYSIHPDRGYRFMFALGVFTAQYITSFIFPGIEGYSGWLAFLFLIGRVLGIHHPPVADNRPLDLKRKIIGWVAVAVFILSFSPKPLIIEITEPTEQEEQNDEKKEGDNVETATLFFEESNDLSLISRRDQ